MEFPFLISYKMGEKIRDGFMEKRTFEQVLQLQAWVQWHNGQMDRYS